MYKFVGRLCEKSTDRLHYVPSSLRYEHFFSSFFAFKQATCAFRVAHWMNACRRESRRPEKQRVLSRNTVFIAHKLKNKPFVSVFSPISPHSAFVISRQPPPKKLTFQLTYMYRRSFRFVHNSVFSSSHRPRSRLLRCIFPSLHPSHSVFIHQSPIMFL